MVKDWRADSLPSFPLCMFLYDVTIRHFQIYLSSLIVEKSHVSHNIPGSDEAFPPHFVVECFF